MRHLSSGIDCAMAGAAIVAAPATPSPVALIKSRRFMLSPSWKCVGLHFEACPSMEHLASDFHPSKTQKPNLVKRLGSVIYDLRRKCSYPVQPRVRDRIMKLSKVYSATCH